MDIALYDTTLRDGCQAHGFSLTVEDKLRVAQRLDDLGFAYIEGGWPGSNPRDEEFFARAGGYHWRHARLAAFGSTRRAGISAEDDASLLQLVRAETPVATIVGKSSADQVRIVFGVPLEENLAMIGDSVRFLKAAGREVMFDAEHFFDGYHADPEYALACLAAAREGGADWLVLCDTNGGTLPSTVAAVCREVVRMFGDCIGIHTHNDSEVAVANTLAAVESGVRQVQGTINGYGERVGNANLCSLIPNLQLKLGHRCLPDASVQHLTALSRYVGEIGSAPQMLKLPYVGKEAFAHKAGLHANAVMKATATYEHVSPETVGNVRQVLVSDLSGRSNIEHKLAEFGLSVTPEQLFQLAGELKAREHQGLVYEDADASVELLALEMLDRRRPLFSLDHYTVETRHDGNDDGATAEVVVRAGGAIGQGRAAGDGPVHALDLALRTALLPFYPHLTAARLTDYKVRVVDNETGTDARVRVWIQATDGQRTWNTVGASRNIVTASASALVDSLEYYLAAAEAATDDGSAARMTG